MQINRNTDYVYRVLMYIAINNQRRVTRVEIAKYYGISHEHLRKVIHKLSILNYIKTYGGRGGGIELNKLPEEINIGQLFLEFEGINPLIDCEQSLCPLRSSCNLDNLFTRAHRVFYQELKKETLADLIANENVVKSLQRFTI